MRYHQEWRKGLSGGMGTLEKFMAMGYEVPEMDRKFMPK